ncbi:DUF4129 domain-containing protein [Saxibacter everestensis]|uniref:DUF4129 domain-containing protein n=1 Tax=Saxibacter everestensis TaxID=2909229 RepID=A0ABY8QP30_9MICO|nr:DUF4129 domain-containing protein [Brevibacteriaceae bacterium ZFBP1038]
MTMQLSLYSLVSGATPDSDPPLQPSDDEARRWVLEELGKPEYRQGDVTLLERIGATIERFFSSFDGPGVPVSPVGVVILIVVVVGLIGVAVWWAGKPRRRGLGASANAVFDVDSTLSAAAHRNLAERAARIGDWQVAIRERFRAIARELEERTIIEPRPGRTAHEIATEAGPILPEIADRLLGGAGIFDDVCYGSRPASAAQYGELKSLDQSTAKAKPEFDAAAPAAGWAGPQ